MAEFIPAWLGKSLATRTRALRPDWLNTSLSKREVEVAQVDEKPIPTFEAPSCCAFDGVTCGFETGQYEELFDTAICCFTSKSHTRSMFLNRFMTPPLICISDYHNISLATANMK